MSRTAGPTHATPLHATATGRGRPVALLHGFTQTAASWRPVVDELRGHHRVTTLDLPGHGTSSHLTADLARSAELVRRTCGRAVYVGYSMGGRVALRLALDHPDAVAGLVLIGATAGIDDPAERARRRAADHALADRLEAEGTDAFLDDWLALPLFEGLTPAADDLASRRANPPAGLAASLRLAGTGTMDPPWWGDLADVAVPTLVLAGEHDARFRALGRRLAASIGPAATFEVVPETGHASHLQRPAEVADLIRALVARVPAGPGDGGERASPG